MEVTSACSHPGWFLLTLLLGLLLWARRRRVWDPRQCPTDLSGRTVIVTGANSGELGPAGQRDVAAGLRAARLGSPMALRPSLHSRSWWQRPIVLGCEGAEARVMA